MTGENAVKTKKPSSKKTVKVKSDTAVKQPRKKKPMSLNVQKSRMGWLFISPFLIGFLLIYLPMIVESIQFSFCEFDKNQALQFVGWENYSYALLEDVKFRETLLLSIKDLLFNVPAIVIFSLFMAVILNQKMRGRAIFRAIFFIPVIVSTGIIETIDLQNSLAANMEQISGSETDMEGANSGAEIISSMDVMALFSNMKIGAGVVKYVTGLVNNVYGIINKSGVQMLIFLAGLQSISPAIYESCHIDGASAWETFWKITFPMISPMILVNTVYTIIDSFTSQSNKVMSYISVVYKDISKGTFHATAMSWIYFLIVVLILALIAGILSAWVFYQRRDT